MKDNIQSEAGYLYIANTMKYLKEAQTSSKSLKTHSHFQVCLLTTDALLSSGQIDGILFDKIIVLPEIEEMRYNSKITGIPLSPFKKTVYLDTDTFICANIDALFDLLDRFDIACTIDPTNHTSPFIEDKEKIKLINIFPEFHTGLIAYIKNKRTIELFTKWKIESYKMRTYYDMPSFREAILNSPEIKFTILPVEYNFHGFHSYAIAHNEIKVIHARFGERRDTLTLIAEGYEKMLQRAKNMNRIQGKRIYIPYIGFISASYNLYRLKYKLKKLLGIRLTSKRNTY